MAFLIRQIESVHRYEINFDDFKKLIIYEYFPQNSSASINSTELGANNFATLRTTSIVTRQLKEHARDNQLQEQMSGYKRMRRQHQKAIMQLEDKCRQEFEEQQQKLDKEYDALLQQFKKDLEKQITKQQQELEKKVEMFQYTKLKIYLFFFEF